MTPTPDPLMHLIPSFDAWGETDPTSPTGFRCGTCQEVIIWAEGAGWLHTWSSPKGDLFPDWLRPGLSHEPRVCSRCGSLALLVVNGGWVHARRVGQSLEEDPDAPWLADSHFPRA